MTKTPGNKILTTLLIIVGSLIIVLLLVIIVFISPLNKIIFPEESAPTLALVVTEPPKLDKPTGKYRVVVEALVTGNPEPEVLFNRNDGLGIVERNQALVLLDEGEAFMLTAIAANSAGEARAALEINSGVTAGEGTEVVIADNNPDSSSGNAQANSDNQVDNSLPEDNGQGANVNEPVENVNNGADNAEAPAEVNNEGQSNGEGNQGTERVFKSVRIAATPSLSGCILQDTEVKTGVIMVGDATNNKQIKGFLSFDISAYSNLNGFQIDDGELLITDIIKTGKPTDFAAAMIIEYTHYGSTLDLADYYSDRIQIISYDSAAIGNNIGIMYHGLEDSFRQYFILSDISLRNQNLTKIQYMFTLNNITDFDGVVDAFVFYPADAELLVNYNYLE